MSTILTERGVEKRANEDIVILVSSIPKLIELNQRFVFTDAHAYYSWAKFYSDPKDLEKIDWACVFGFFSAKESIF